MLVAKTWCAAVLATATATPPSNVCPAKPLWQEAADSVPEKADNRALRGRLAHELREAGRLSAISNPDVDDWIACDASLRSLQEVVPQLDGPTQASIRPKLDRELTAVQAQLPPAPPPPSPQEAWTRRNRKLTAGVAVSGSFLGIGILVMALGPAIACRPVPEDEVGCELEPLIYLSAGGVVAIASLATFGVLLANLVHHRQLRPNGMRSRVGFGPGGLQVQF